MNGYTDLTAARSPALRQHESPLESTGPTRQRTIQRELWAAPAQRWTVFHSALAVLLLTYIWRIQDLLPILSSLQIVSASTAAAVILFFGLGYSRNISASAKHRVFKLALFILLLMVASIPAGIFMGNSFRFVQNDYIKTFVLMVLVMCGVRGTRNIDRFLLVHIAGALAYSAFTLRTAELFEGRLLGLVYYDANDLGMLIVCTLPFCVYFMRKGAGLLPRLLALTATPVLLLAFVRSGSRGAFLGLLAVATFMLFRFSAISRKARIIAVTAGMVALVGIGGNQYFDLMKTLLNPTADYNWVGNQDTGRMEVWKRGMGYMIRRPILGVGVNNFYVAEGTLSSRGREQQFGRGFKWSAAHNSFVQIGAELGVFGLAAFIALLYSGFRTAYQRQPQSRDPARLQQDALGQAFACALVGFTITAFFLSQAYGAFLYTLIGMIIAFDLSRTADTGLTRSPSLSYRAQPIGRGGLITGSGPAPAFTSCVCSSVSVCVCGAAHRSIQQ